MVFRCRGILTSRADFLNGLVAKFFATTAPQATKFGIISVNRLTFPAVVLAVFLV